MKITQALRKLLFPFSFIYGSVMAVRNLFFQVHIFNTKSFNIPVISVGNISVGGTGKTPHIEYLIELFKKDKRVAVLSRGYKRTTKGFKLVLTTSSGAEAGDEPLQIKQKFPGITVAVDEKRVNGISCLLVLENPPELILLDDAFQHRWVKPGFQILLDNFNSPIRRDMVLPAGNLREFTCGKKRADLVIATKCDGITESEVDVWRKWYKKTHPNSLFFSHFKYANPVPVFENSVHNLEYKTLQSAHVLVVTGIANPKPFEQFVKSKCLNIEKLSFPDHHLFAESDIDLILQRFEAIESKEKYIITTEKDAVRLRAESRLNSNVMSDCFYISIKVDIMFQQEELLRKKIVDYVR